MVGGTLTPQEFVTKWRGAQLSERASVQEHFLNPCTLFGQPSPADADPTGSWYTFEKGVTKTGGGQGFADVWKRGFFAWEYKKKKRDLGEAFKQLLLYRIPLENPPLLVVCDIDRYEIHTNFTGTAENVYSFTNEQIGEPATLRTLRALFDNPEALRPALTIQQVTEDAAQRFAALADGLRARGVEPERAAHFLTQLLFCLFAEDVALLPADAFGDVVRFGVRRPETFLRNVTAPFTAMRDGGEANLREIDRFNGGLFATIDPLDLTPAELAALDWGSVDTAIIGTLFERSLDPSKRSQLGAHYTGQHDIQRIVEPVVMAPLRREWAAVKIAADKKRAEAERETGFQARRNRQNELGGILLAFKERLAGVRILDPACGSGNFLTVALGALLDLEKEVVAYGAAVGLAGMFPDVSPRQLYGLEVNAYAHELAQVAVWIAYLQWMTANGFQPRRDPVLQPLDTIRLQDSLLDRSDPAHPKEAAWPEAEFIIGNPPFLGDKKMRGELGREYVSALWKVYHDRVPGGADLVCYFFEKACSLFPDGTLRQADLLATNSIRGGANRYVLDQIKQTGDIFMAWTDEPWVLEGANVRISIVGFAGKKADSYTLNGKVVVSINPDLTHSLNITEAKVLPENSGIAFLGVQKGAPFDIPGDLARKWLSMPLNPNGRPNSDVLRPRLNGFDIMRRSQDNWIIDFGVFMEEADAALYEAPYEYLLTYVKPVRATNAVMAYRKFWWLHARPRPNMRTAVQNLARFICTPTVAKHRVFVWSDKDTLPDHQLIVVARADDYFFGVLHSRAHELWSLRLGTSLEDRPRYTPTTTFETYPYPWPPGTEPTADPRVVAIAEAARRLVDLRDRWLNPPDLAEAEVKKRTLTNLYNARPTWLDHAHKALDRAVLDAYGWPRDLTDDDLLARLLALNAERTAARP